MRGLQSSVATLADVRSRPDQDFHLGVAVTVLRGGGVVAHATEAVWGLACNAFDSDAVARLLQLKGRSVDKGLIVIGSDASFFAAELAAVDERTAAEVLDSWPGPETWLLPNRSFPFWITGRRPEVAVRVPGHLQSRQLCARLGGALVSTSANRSDRIAARNELTVRRYFGDGVDYVLPGRVDGAASPSRIRHASSHRTIR
jgi:L-threonylcarbamoyladenylate synthase